MEFSKVAEVQRLAVNPGDSVVIRVRDFITRSEGESIARQAREQLKLPDTVGLMVTDNSGEVFVVESGPGSMEAWFKRQMHAYEREQLHRQRLNGGLRA